MVTSALTIAEVLFLRRVDGEPRRRFPSAEEPRVADLFNPVPPRRFVLVDAGWGEAPAVAQLRLARRRITARTSA